MRRILNISMPIVESPSKLKKIIQALVPQEWMKRTRKLRSKPLATVRIVEVGSLLDFLFP